MHKLFFIVVGCLLFFTAYLFTYDKINFVTQFGKKGQQDGEFNKPVYSAVDDEKIYVVDNENSKIQIFDLKGNFLKSFGTKGNLNSQFNKPIGIALNKDKIFVTDSGNNRIQVFDKEGNFISFFGTKGNLPGQFNAPSGISYFQGRIYIADSGNDRIQIFSSTGIFLGEFGIAGNEAGRFNNPVDLSIDSAGNIYILDEGNFRVQKFDNDGKFLLSFGGKGESQDLFSKPCSIWVDKFGFIYVADKGVSKIKRYDSSGKFISSFGTKGEGIGQFKDICKIIFKDNNLFIIDCGNSRIQVIEWKIEEESIKEINQAKEKVNIEFFSNISAECSDLYIDSKNLIYCASQSLSNVTVFNKKGEEILKFGAKGNTPSQFNNPTNIIVDNSGNMFVVDSGNSRIQKFDSTGKYLLSFGKKGGKEGEFSKPQGIAQDAVGNLYIIDSAQGKIQVFTQDGIFLRMFGKKGNLPSDFKEPVDIAISSTGNIYILNKGTCSVKIFDNSFNFISEFGKLGKGISEFTKPESIMINSKEEILVSDSKLGRVQIFDSKGIFLWKFGAKGKYLTEFLNITSATQKDTFVYISDTGSKMIKILKLKVSISKIEKLATDVSFDKIKLTWDKIKQDYFDHYNIYKQKDKTFEKISETKDNFFEDKGLESNTKYNYAVSVQLSDGEEGEKISIEVTTLKLVPKPPQNLIYESGYKEIKLSWDKSDEKFILGYKVYKSKDGQNYNPVSDIKENSYLFSGLEPDTVSYYQISAYSKDGESEKTQSIQAKTKSMVPEPPANVRAETTERDIKLTWEKSKEEFAKGYKIYRKEKDEFQKIIELQDTTYTDKNLAYDTTYYYQITAYSDYGESKPSLVISVTTQKAPLIDPLEVIRINMEKVFSANYKYYSESPICNLTIKNNTAVSLKKTNIIFTIKDFMDYPSDKIVEEILPQQILEIPIYATFNNKILDVTEDTPIQAEIKINYELEGKVKTITKNIPFTLYSRNALIWDRTDKLATFITPKDETLKEFARLTVAQYEVEVENIPLPPNLITARIIFAALGVYGIVYITDPTNPYLSQDKDKETVDYVQFPRETLKNKSGDCDDLTALFSAALENIAVPTSLVSVPGHIFVMFDSGIDEMMPEELGFSRELYVPYQGGLWIPVEATLVGQSFLRAWQEGAKEYNKWEKQNKAQIIDLSSAWKIYKPATLPRDDFKIQVPLKDKIEEKFKNEWNEIINLRIQNLARTPQEILDINPYDAPSYQQLGLIYAEHKKYPEAEKYFKKVVELDPYNASAYNNLGNIYMMTKNYPLAIEHYNKALLSDPKDVGILANLSLVYYYSGDLLQAKEHFARAIKLDEEVIYQYEKLHNLLK